MNNYSLKIIIFLFVYFTQIQCDPTETETTFDSTVVISTTVSTTSSTSTVTSPSSSPYSTSAITSTSSSNEPDEITGLHLTSLTTINSSIDVTSMTIITSTEHVTSSATMNSSTVVTSMTTTTTTSTPTTSQPININVTLTYKYDVQSPFPLTTENITNSTILASVQTMVVSSFNLSNFTITVTRVEIRSPTKTSNYVMFTDNLFQSSRNDCSITCIKNSVSNSTPTQSFELPANNGSLVNVSAISVPSLVDDTSSVTTTTTTTAIVNYQKGESPPGVAAQLGMGLGITIIGVLLIVEIIYLYRKYGWNRARRQSNYELTSYHHRLSA